VPGVDAIGHVDPSGGGAINMYGLAFELAGATNTSWAAICKQDSDGDGQSNGFEVSRVRCCCASPGGGVARVAHTGGARATRADKGAGVGGGYTDAVSQELTNAGRRAQLP